MKTISWLVIAVIVVTLGITLFVQNRNTESIEPVTPTETAGQMIVESTKETEKTIDVQYTLQTIAEGGKLLFQGVGGEIDGVINTDEWRGANGATGNLPTVGRKIEVRE